MLHIMITYSESNSSLKSRGSQLKKDLIQTKWIMPSQTRADLTSPTTAFKDLCMSKLHKSSASIIPSRPYLDVIENILSTTVTSQSYMYIK